MNYLKNLYKESTQKMVKDFADVIVRECYDRAKYAASNAKPTASYTVSSDCPKGAHEVVRSRLKEMYQIESEIHYGRDTDYEYILYLSGWAE